MTVSVKLRFLPVFLLYLAAPSVTAAQCMLCGKPDGGPATPSRKADTPLRIDIETQASTLRTSFFGL